MARKGGPTEVAVEVEIRFPEKPDRRSANLRWLKWLVSGWWLHSTAMDAKAAACTIHHPCDVRNHLTREGFPDNAQQILNCISFGRRLEAPVQACVPSHSPDLLLACSLENCLFQSQELRMDRPPTEGMPDDKAQLAEVEKGTQWPKGVAKCRKEAASDNHRCKVNFCP